VKDHYNKNYKTLLKNLRKTLEDFPYSPIGRFNIGKVATPSTQSKCNST
jgi:hypothetical protein